VGRRWLGAVGAIAVIAGLALITRQAPLPGSAPVDGTTDQRVGTAAPDVTLPLLGGGELALASLRGKVVAVDFWATYCGPCVRTMPHLQQLADTLPDDQFELYSVNVDPDTDDRDEVVSGFMERQELSFPVVLDNGRATWLYGADRIPLLVVVDREGIVRHVFRGFVDPANIDRAIHDTLALANNATGSP
jgi:thiol-disulfide isomerase/thioredoxin